MTQPVPTPEQISALTDQQVEAATGAWQQVRGTEEYLSGRDAVTRAVGKPSDLPVLNRAVADLAALEQAVKDRFSDTSGKQAKGLDSSARWAYLAIAHPDVISDAQRVALMAGWNAMFAPSGSRNNERNYWRLSWTGLAFEVLSVALTGAMVGVSQWLLAVVALMVSLGLVAVWLRAATALRQGRAASYRFGLTILAAVQAGLASYWLAATGTSPAPDALIALQPSVAVFFIGVPAIIAALFLGAALDTLARRRAEVSDLPEAPRAYRTLGVAGVVSAVLSAGSALYVHEALWVLSVIVVLASLEMIRDWVRAPHDLTRLRVHWASILPAMALIPAGAALVQVACVLGWITTDTGQESQAVLTGVLLGLPCVAAALFTAAKLALAKNLRAAGALTYTEQTGHAA
jgi:hypothetical protein